MVLDVFEGSKVKSVVIPEMFAFSTTTATPDEVFSMLNVLKCMSNTAAFLIFLTAELTASFSVHVPRAVRAFRLERVLVVCGCEHEQVTRLVGAMDLVFGCNGILGEDCHSGS